MKLYRRHTKACLKTAAVKRLSKAEKDIYPHCDCACYFTGHWGDTYYPRTSLHTGDWKKAQIELQKRQIATTLDGAEATGVAGGTRVSITVAEALEEWHSASELHGFAKGTLRFHVMMADELLAVVNPQAQLASVGPKHIAKIRRAWNERLTDRSHFIYLASLGSFFKFAVDPPNRWILHTPLPPMKFWPSEHGEDVEPTLPLDPDGGDANYRAILATVAVPARDMGKRYRHPIRTNKENLVKGLELMYESGLRVSDLTRFNPSKLRFMEDTATYTFLPWKTRRYKRLCTTFVPADLARAIQALKPLSDTGHPFFDGTDFNDETQHERCAECIRGSLNEAAAVLGLEDVRPHRFRDSFAINFLNAGGDIRDLQGFLGHSTLQMTEAAYAPKTKSTEEVARRRYAAAQRQRALHADPNVIPFPAKQA